MGYEKDYRNDYNASGTMDVATSFSKVMRNVYAWMTLGLLITALTSYLVASTPSIIESVFTKPAITFGLFLTELALVIILSARIDRMSAMTAGLMFALYAILNGVTMSFIFLLYTAASITSTFLVTAGTFAGMTLVGYLTKRDLSTMGRALYMCLIGIIIATVVNIFMKSDGLYMLLNYAGVIIFVGLTAYDTQKVKVMAQYASTTGDEEQTTKLALMGSLTLYLDFVNLFLYLLRLFGRRR